MHEAQHLPMKGPWSLGNNADVTPLEYVGEFIHYSVRDSAVESEDFVS